MLSHCVPGQRQSRGRPSGRYLPMLLDQRTYAVQDQEVFQWLREKISQTRRIRPENVQMESSLAEDLVPDSFELIELVCAIENKFGFSINYDDFADIDSVGDVVDFIQQHSAARQ